MASSHSVSHWIERLRAGNQIAAPAPLGSLFPAAATEMSLVGCSEVGSGAGRPAEASSLPSHSS